MDDCNLKFLEVAKNKKKINDPTKTINLQEIILLSFFLLMFFAFFATKHLMDAFLQYPSINYPK